MRKQKTLTLFSEWNARIVATGFKRIESKKNIILQLFMHQQNPLYFQNQGIRLYKE